MPILKTARRGLWRTITRRHQPLLHGAYEKVRVQETTRQDLDALLGPSKAKHYLARCQDYETVEVITDPQTRKVIAKKYIVTGPDSEVEHDAELRFESTMQVVREIRNSRRRPRRVLRGPHYHQPAQPTTLFEWFAGPAAEKLLGRAMPGDSYFVNGRPIQPRAYRTLLASTDGGDLLVEVRSTS